MKDIDCSEKNFWGLANAYMHVSEYLMNEF